jgi:hypothetical protein
MAARNPALSTAIVGRVSLYYKDVEEALTYNVDVTRLLGVGEEVDPGTVTSTVTPVDVSLDHSVVADASNITLYVDQGGTVNQTYEFQITFDSTLGNPYVDYVRVSIKTVYKQC